MDTVEGVPKSLIHWSLALLVGILLFSFGFFLYLRLRERRLARERVVFMEWNSRTSIAWVMTAAALLLVTLLTYVRLDGHRSGGTSPRGSRPIRKGATTMRRNWRLENGR